MKECRTCHILKDETEFSVNRIDQKTGTIFYKPDCKACKRKTDKGIKRARVTKLPTDDPMVQDYLMLTQDEIKTLKLIVSQLKIIPLEDKSNRTPRSVNIDNTLFERVQELAIKKNISISDLINLLIAKSLELITN